MDTIVKSFTGLFFTMLLLVMGVGIIITSINARSARSFGAECVARIENSDFAQDVIEDCRKEAKALGYEMTVTEQEADNSPGNHYGTLRLSYPFRVPVIGVARQNLLELSIR